MHSTILLIFVVIQICSSSIVFRITSNNENVTINSSYLFGTIHIAQNLIWSYLSNKTLRLLNESNQIWLEQDFTDPKISKYIYECSLDKMTIKQRARVRAKTWARFLNETNDKSNNLELWRKWFVDTEFSSNNYLWRNKTITNDTIFDHRIILEAYQRGAYVGSLESLPDDCFEIEKSKTNQTQIEPIYQIIFSRTFNCDMIDDDFIKELYKGLDFLKMKKRNEQMTKHIRQLIKTDPQEKYLFAVGAAHLFGNISIVQMLQDQYPNDYRIEQIDFASQNFPYQNCTDEEFTRLANELNSVQNNTMTKRFIVSEFF
jgi:uncharacterized protein YbaP (TraB family)